MPDEFEALPGPKKVATARPIQPRRPRGDTVEAHRPAAPVPAAPAPPSLDDLARSLRDLADRVSGLDASQARSRFPSSRFGRGLRSIHAELARLEAAVDAVRRDRADREGEPGAGRNVPPAGPF